MPKLKRGAPRHARNVRGTKAKRGAGNMTGVIAKAKKKLRKPPSQPAAAPAAETEPEMPPLPPAKKPSTHAAGERRRREAKSMPPTRKEIALAAAKLPKDLGVTAERRHSAFVRKGRDAGVAARLAQYHARKAGAHIRKLANKGRVAQAAATLGGLVRDPDVRLLLNVGQAAAQHTRDRCDVAQRGVHLGPQPQAALVHTEPDQGDSAGRAGAARELPDAGGAAAAEGRVDYPATGRGDGCGGALRG